MQKIRTTIIMLCILLLSSVLSFAQDADEVPVVALVKMGDLRPLNLAQQGTLDLFAEYGYVDGENIEFILAEAQFDMGVLETVMQAVLESEPDVIIASATPVAIMAANLTAEMDNPPAIFINSVTSVYGTGIAQASCIKPENLSGSQALPPFDLMLQIITEFDPEIERIGVIYNENEANAVFSVGLISEFAEDFGLEIIEQPVASGRVVRASAETLVGAGVDAFLVPPDASVFAAVPELAELGELAGIPVITTVDDQVYSGATLGIGLNYYQEGIDNARMAIAYLNGDIDIATTAISNQTGISIAVNLDSAAAQNVEIPNGFMAQVDYVIEDGESTEVDPALTDVSFEVRQELDNEFLAELLCTDDLIAEQQANLDDE